jgi:outer membrane protein OmpU
MKTEGKIMKKILFATTALVATASVAAADVTFSGFAYAGVRSVENADTDITQSVRINANASVETDGGVTFSAHKRVVSGNGSSNYGFVKVSSGGAQVTIGNTHGAIRKIARQVLFVGYDNGGLTAATNAPGSVTQNDGSDNIYASYSVGGLTLGVSTQMAENVVTTTSTLGTAAATTATETTAVTRDGRDVEFGASYTMNGITVAAAATTADTDFWAAKVTGSVAGLSLGLGFNELDETVFTASGSIGAATTVDFGYEDNSAGGRYGVAVNHDLGGNVSLIGDVMQDESDVTTMGLGVYFNF